MNADLPKTLLKYSKEGKLTKICNIVKYYDFLGQGTQAIAFIDTKTKKVYKIVPKNIRYFKAFPDDTPKDLKIKIKSLRLFFLRIRGIKYDDKNVFLYTQSYGEKTTINPYFITSIFLLIIAMLKTNLIVEDISDHNISIHKDNIVSYDFHGMNSIDIDDDGKILNENWGNRLTKKLLQYAMCCNINNDEIINCFNTININESIERLKVIYLAFKNKHYNSFTNVQKNYINMKSKYIEL